MNCRCHIAIVFATVCATGQSTAVEPTSEVGWLAEIQTIPDGPIKDAPELQPLVDEEGSHDEWQKRREELRQQWLEFLGPLASAERKLPKLETLSEDAVDGVVRKLVRYETEPGETTEAYLLLPAQLDGKTAGVAVFHSTYDSSIRQPAGVKGDPEKAFGLKLAKLGYVTLCPRNYLWPENDKIQAQDEAERLLKRHEGSKGMAKMLCDSMLAVDILASLPEVDPERIGAVGHSLGAKETLYLAAFDERVKVTVSSEGGIGTNFSNWDAPWYLGPSINGGAFTMQHHELLSLCAPRAFLLIGGDSADGEKSWPFIAASLPVYRLTEKTPRVGLYNHRQGHAVPPEAEKRIYEWFNTYLPAN
jgi:dienelactone hydrolase